MARWIWKRKAAADEDYPQMHCRNRSLVRYGGLGRERAKAYIVAAGIADRFSFGSQGDLVSLPRDNLLFSGLLTESPSNPWRLPGVSTFERAGVKASGWMEMGITFNSHGRGNGYNGPVLLNDRANEFQLNQFWLRVDRPVTTDSDAFDLGGRIDMAYGTDWRFASSLGLEDGINSRSQFYGLIPVQFYLEAGFHDLKIKLGHMAAGMSYETGLATNDFFYSHAIGFLYGSASLITGVVGDLKLSDQWSIRAGLHRGPRKFEDNNDHLDIIAGLRWTSHQKQTSLAVNTSIGPQDAAGEHTRYDFSLVFKHRISEKLRYAMHDTFTYEYGTGPNGRDSQWCGVMQSLFYDISEHWSVGARGEWFHDDDSARLIGLGHLFPGHAWPGGPVSPL